jgi:uridine phosphorylase
MKIGSSELIINDDGSVFHLHLKPEQLADTVLLVGDPARVDLICNHFDSIECAVNNREFVTKTGRIGQKRITVCATGIGTDNIDIVINELDALANIDFNTRAIRPKLRQLTLLRLGTSGAIQPHIPIGSIVMSDVSIGFDGLLNYYAHRDKVSQLDIEAAFVQHMNWNKQLPSPYFVASDPSLIALFGKDVLHGYTVSAPGFYGPQGRVLRLPLVDPDLLAKLESFNYQGQCVTNFEMEGSAIAGLSLLLGHKASTLCAIIANRHSQDMNTDYKVSVNRMIELVLASLS